MPAERSVEITPSPSALIGSLRGLGYSPETALADLVDNSIAAGATTIELDVQWNDGAPSVAVLDDGQGMSRSVLAAALRLGGTGPEVGRSESDLGRYGLGLKTASLSQCRRLTIVSRHASETNALCLDVDIVQQHGWIAVVPEPLPDHPLVASLNERPQGTLILWERMDALGGLTGLDKESFFLRLQDIRAHFGMVFHRFLGGDARRLSIAINGRQVKAWDPFQRQHPATIEMRNQPISHGGSSITIKPYVLPHRDRFANDSEYEAAGGPGGWGARQGFYVYRGKRLLVAGSWLGLGGARTWTREESSRLARIEIDLPTDLDKDWRIDVRKSQARPPGGLRPRLTAIAGRCRAKAREVFAWRGRGPRTTTPSTGIEPIWIAHSGASGTRYRINREHPALQSCLKGSNADSKLLNALLAVIEQSVPVERIWLDVSESEGATVPQLDADELALLTEQLAALSTVLPETMPIQDRVELLLCNLPGQQVELRRRLFQKLGASA